MSYYITRCYNILNSIINVLYFADSTLFTLSSSNLLTEDGAAASGDDIRISDTCCCHYNIDDKINGGC